MRRNLISLYLISLLFLSCSQGGSSPYPIVVPLDFAGLIHAGSSNNLDWEYDLLNELGSSWVHRDFSWSSIQRDAEKDLSPDQWNWESFDSFVERANNEGKKILGMLLYDVEWVHVRYGNDNERRIFPNEIDDFCTYARETVKRYNGKNGHGKVDVWCIWNEPNLANRFWKGTQEEFFELTKTVAHEIRVLDEDEDTKTFLIGGAFNTQVTNDWIDGIYTYGAMDEIDGIAFHPYMISAESTNNAYNNFKNNVAKYGFNNKIWINEVGYPTYSEKNSRPPGRYGTDAWEGDMPDQVTKTIALLAASGARTLYWYHLFDGPTRNDNDSEDWFGLVWRKSDEEWIRKGGYWGYALCANNLPGKTLNTGRFAYLDKPYQKKSLYFEGPDKSRVLIIWNESAFYSTTINMKLPGKNHNQWSTVDGSSTSIGPNVVQTLYPVRQSDSGPNLLFFTWDE